jgi:hypothetical protein
MPTIIVPPHFHIVGADFQVLLVVIAGEARPSQLAEAMQWVQTNQKSLVLKWDELNERG